MKSWLVIGLLGWLFGVASLQAGEVAVTRVATEVRGDTLYVDADARLELFGAQREALESGVPLTFAWEFVIEQERDWLWAREVASQTIRARIEYHALSRLYRLVWPESEESATFTSLVGALEALTQLRNVALGPAGDFPAHGTYRGRARLRLLLDTLPLPMRPRAYFSERWALASEWYLWAF
ncbi:MAG: DUF4390 domain-containing protein [Pseudomonadota bacterium]